MSESGPDDPAGAPAPAPAQAGLLVSVVISNHNYAPFLGACIDSALTQTYRPLEVVVVDDGSSDGSRSIIGDFGDRVRPVLTGNRGQAAALNAGFAASRGRLILFLDADDLLEPEAAATLAAAWRPGVGRIQGRVTLIDGDGRRRGGGLPADPLPDGDVRPLVLRSGGYPSTGTTGAAFARDPLERIMPIPETEWRRAPDVYLLLLAPFVGLVAAVDRPVGSVRIHGRNSWSMERLTADRLVEHLDMDRRKERLLHERAADLGTRPPADWLERSTAHLQSRLALLRLDPRRHPFPRDGRLRLARLGMAAALRNPGFSIRKRLLLAGWFLLAGVLPSRAAGGVVRAGFVRTARPGWVQRFIERGATP
jgi:glycosyltransferase involved in cell wall biosynthesis